MLQVRYIKICLEGSLANLKSETHKFDIGKLETTPVDLRKLRLEALGKL